MNFWEEYGNECLQSPWVIRPLVITEEGTSDFTVGTGKIFVVEQDLPDSAFDMIGKMIAALKYDPSEVSVLEESENLVSNFENLSDKKRILFFGSDLPGHFGEAIHWAGHQVVQTYGIRSLQMDPNLKKETWAHLKSFASLK